MLKQLKDMLRSLDEDIKQTELEDLAYTKYYTRLCKRRKAIAKAIKVFERCGDT